MDEDKKVILVDGSGYIFRAYYALPPMRNSQNIPVNAVFGFFKMLLKLRQDYQGHCLMVVFDSGRKTFRNEIDANYKANRSEPPEDLVPQFSLIRDAAKALSVPQIEVKNYEADDIIASLARHAKEKKIEVMIVSSDKDLMQLVQDNISLYDPMKNRAIGAKEVEERFGVLPAQVIDVQALAGDSTDNIPGAVGIGVKTAAMLINEYGSLDALLTRADEIKQPKRRENIIAFRSSVQISRALVTLRCDVPEMENVDFTPMADLDKKTAALFVKMHGFKSLEHYFEDNETYARDSESNPSQAEVQIIKNAASFQQFMAQVKMQGYVAFDVRLSARGALCGVAFALDNNTRYYLPLGHHRALDAQGDLLKDAFAAAENAERPQVLCDGQIEKTVVLPWLLEMFQDGGIIKIGYHIKQTLHQFGEENLTIVPAADVMVMSFVLDAGKTQHHWQSLCAEHLSTVSDDAKKNDSPDFAALAIDEAANISGHKALQIFALYQIFYARLCLEGMMTLYQKLEIPLIPILAQMENAGIALDVTHLQNLSAEFAADLQIIEAEIFAITQEKFNIGSPKQLGEILFEKLALPHGRKTKTGQYSTDNDLLDNLVLDGHAIAGKIQQWRHISKLRSTYTESLPMMVGTDGRVHTSFSMTGAQTGRLSSIDPNLQNIPIRDHLGKKIRESFIAPQGRLLLSLDYSQIELRLVAHIAKLDSLIAAFARGDDVHRFTAAQVFDIPMAQVSAEQRRSAKAVNFGIIYGISAFGLARQLMIPQKQAKEYIDAYFQHYQGLKNYQDETIELAEAQGYVTTLYGRKIHLPHIKDKNPAKRNYAGRQAVNAPVQGSAADIIKKAMLLVALKIQDEKLPVRLLLQVHDELVFEAEADAADEMAEILCAVMMLPGENLSVPLLVDSGIGKNWAEAH